MTDREKLIELLDDIQRCGEDYTDYEIYGMRIPDTVSNEEVASHLISHGVTVRERGRWEQVERWATKAKYRCSVCGREIMSAVAVNIEKYPFCHCGADMRGEEDGT